MEGVSRVRQQGAAFCNVCSCVDVDSCATFGGNSPQAEYFIICSRLTREIGILWGSAWAETVKSTRWFIVFPHISSMKNQRNCAFYAKSCSVSSSPAVPFAVAMLHVKTSQCKFFISPLCGLYCTLPWLDVRSRRLCPLSQNKRVVDG